MKKLLSVILAIIMTLSVFSCVSVYAVEDVTVPETENTTEGDVVEPPTDEPTTEEIPGSVVNPPYEIIVENTVDGILLKWDSVARAVQYNVYRRAAGESSFKLIAEIPEEDLTQGDEYVDVDVTSGNYYKYAIKTIAEDSESELRESGLARYVASPEFTVENHQNGVILQWQTVPGASNYIIYRREAGQTNAKFYARVGGNLTKYVDGKAKSGFYYEYFMVSSSDSRTDKYTSSRDAKGVVIKCVGVTTVLTLINKNDGVELCWQKVPGATGYMIYRRSAGEPDFTYLATAGNIGEYIDSSAVSGKFYTYIARAVSNNYVGCYKDIHKVIMRLDTPIIQAAANGNDGIYVRWNNIPGATEYHIFRRNAGEKDFKLIGKTTDIRYKDTTTVYGKYYAYKVRAAYTKCYSEFSPTPIVWRFIPLNGKVTDKVAFNMYKGAVETAKKTRSLSFNFITWGECVSAKAVYGNDPDVEAIANSFKNSFIPKKDAQVYTFNNGYGNELVPPCDLDYSKVKSATSVKKGNNYVITIVFKDLKSIPYMSEHEIEKVATVYFDLHDYYTDLWMVLGARDGSFKEVYKNFTVVAEITPSGQIVRLEQKGLADCNFGCKNGYAGKFEVEADVNTYCEYYNIKY